MKEQKGSINMFFYAMLLSLDTDDRDFVEKIFEKYHKYIYEIAFNILHNHQDAEDIVDEVMIKIIKNIEKFLHASENEIKAQIVIYGRNTAINLYNKNKRRIKHEVNYTYVNEDGEIEEIDIEDPSESMAELVIRKETVEIVQRYLQQLSVEHRDAIKLVYALGYSNVEAAKVLEITPNAFRLRLYKAKKKLLELAGGELYDRI